MMIILSEVRYLLDSILPPGSTEVSHLPTQATLYKTGFHGCILSMKVWNNKVSILPWRDIYCFQNLKWIFQFLFQIVDDDSGLGGFGAEIDFTNNKIVRDRVNIKCVDQCL